MFSKSGATNRKFWNFLEYALKSSENQRFSPPKFFATQKTFLNANIMPNLKITLHDWSNIPSEVKRWQ
jgi:hypothetical protein